MSRAAFHAFYNLEVCARYALKKILGCISIFPRGNETIEVQNFDGIAGGRILDIIKNIDFDLKNRVLDFKILIVGVKNLLVTKIRF